MAPGEPFDAESGEVVPPDSTGLPLRRCVGVAIRLVEAWMRTRSTANRRDWVGQHRPGATR